MTPLRIACAYPALALGAFVETPAAAQPAAYDVLDYAVLLQPDLRAKSLTGSTRIAVKGLSGTVERLRFTENSLDLHAVEVDGRPARVNRDGSAIEVVLPRPLRQGKIARLSFSYSGAPERGIVFGEGTAYSNFFTCQWMICDIDRPGDKARFSLDLILPSGTASMASGVLTGRFQHGAGLERHSWRQQRPYSAYLFGFAAGFEPRSISNHRGVELVLAGKLPAAELRRLFEDSELMLDFFVEKAGMELPQARYVQILVPGSEAQEKSTFALLGQRSWTGGSPTQRKIG